MVLAAAIIRIEITVIGQPAGSVRLDGPVVKCVIKVCVRLVEPRSDMRLWQVVIWLLFLQSFRVLAFSVQGLVGRGKAAESVCAAGEIQLREVREAFELAV